MYTHLQNYTFKIGTLKMNTYICRKYYKQFEINTNNKNKSVLPRLETDTYCYSPAIGNPRPIQWTTLGLGYTEALKRLLVISCDAVVCLVYRLEKRRLTDKMDLKTRKSLMFQCFQAIFYLYNCTIFIPPLILILEVLATLNSIAPFLFSLSSPDIKRPRLDEGRISRFPRTLFCHGFHFQHL